MDTQEKIQELADLFAERAQIDERIRCVLEDEEYEEQIEEDEDEAETVFEEEPVIKKIPLPQKAPGKTCTIPDCGKAYSAKGLCSMHYMRQRKGHPMEGEIRQAGKKKELMEMSKKLKMYCEECDWEFEYQGHQIDAVCPKCNSVHVGKSAFQG